MRLLMQPDVQIAAVWPPTGNSNFAVIACAGGNADVDRLLRISELNSQLALSAPMHIFQWKREFCFRVRSRSARCGPPPATGSRLAAQPAAHSCRVAYSTKKHFKEITERATALLPGAPEQIFHIDGALKAAASPVRRRRELCTVLPVCAELVIFSAFLRITQNLVRLLDFLKLLFRLLIVWIQIRMIFARKLPVCLFDLVFLGGTGNSKDFVIIAELHCHGRSLLQRALDKNWRAGYRPRLQSDFETFAGGYHIRVQFAGITQDSFDVRVFVIGVVVVESNAFHLRLNSDIDSLFPTAVSPSCMLGQLLRCVLSINDQEIGVLGEHHHVPVAPADPMFHIRAI